MPDRRLGLYLHIPFCGAICPYCNFTRGVIDAGLKARYVEALAREISGAGRGQPADTIYFGGGTPSLLEPDEVGRLIAACGDAFTLASDSEVTLEANPETVTAESLSGFREMGVNRLSVGVQSFQDEELVRLGRRHDADRARQAMADARAAGFDNVSVDVMIGLPQQRLADWTISVERLVELSPDHASLYLLELYPSAPLRQEMAREGWSLPLDDDAATMYLWALDRLDRAGYVQYEISNVARPGHRARHNLKYWTGGEWYGFGSGAHSTVGGVRWTNLSSTDEYVARLADDGDVVAERRRLTPAEQLEEGLFMGLRLAEGVDIEALGRRHGIDVWGRYGSEVSRFVEAGLAGRNGPRLHLTRRGMLVANDILSVFV